MSKSQSFTEIRTIYPFILLWNLGHLSLERAIVSPDPSSECIAALVFTAFAMEGYLNYLLWWKFRGKLKELSLEEPPNRSTKEKLVAILKTINVEPDFGKRPYQSFSRLFRFRNALAHPKIETVTFTNRQHLGESNLPEFFFPRAEWEKLLNKDASKQIRLDIETIIRDLHQKMGYKDNPLKFSYAESSIYQID